MDPLTATTEFIIKYPNFAYTILFLGSYLETIIGLSFFIMGDFIFLAGAIMAGAGVLNIYLVSVVCILGGILGDSTSYWIGRKFGESIFKRFFKKGNKILTPQKYEEGKEYYHTNGKKSIFYARLFGPLSWITPFIAGSLKVKYKEFLKYNIPGVILGIGMFMILGYLFGISYILFLTKYQTEFLLSLIIILIIVITVTILRIRKALL